MIKLTTNHNILNYRILVLILIIAFLGCRNSLNNLGNGYFLTHNSVNDLAIGKPIKGLPVEETYQFIIYGHIVDYAFDSTFIVVAEKPRDSVPGSLTLTYKEFQRVFRQSNFRQYYVLNKKSDRLYGPFNKSAFLAKRKELNVPDSLRIK
jgi:hypothetical protein